MWAVNTKVTRLVSGEGGSLSEELLELSGAFVSLSKSLQLPDCEKIFFENCCEVKTESKWRFTEEL